MVINPIKQQHARVPRLVSVIIGAYNSARHVGETIDTMLAQTYRPLELIIVDDGSTDDTWQVLQSYGDRIVAVRQANGGVPAARNTGLEHARGEFIALMDHDDLCMPERIAAQIALLDQHPEIGLCCTEFSAFSDQGPIAERYSPYYYAQCAADRGGAAAQFPRKTTLNVASCLPGPLSAPVNVPVYLGSVYDTMACGNFAHPPTVLFRAELIDQIGGFDPKARLSTDWDWLVRAARVTDFAYIDHPLLNYRRSSTQISSERYNKNASVDVVSVAERIAARDPELRRRRGPALRKLLSEVTIDAAYANSEDRPRLAIGLLTKAAWRYRAFNGTAARALFKAMVPDTVLNVARRRRGATRAKS
ncbi:MAG: glycosyltransferase [Aquabacterium sp.]|uniref:glycosyltransferase family 2 protein n=1 Tax=Aquabacterium sp. TaxID=1872578 RepID=UPI0025C05C50|nr:glycosyltransferase [Aquabacterium sp.]MBI3381555.1 glycosyltransferase [Aquabacterium sp.]